MKKAKSCVQNEKAELRKEVCASLKNISDSVSSKSILIREHLLKQNDFCSALQSERLMAFMSMPSEVDIIPFFTENSMIVPFCKAQDIVPIRILSLDELEPSGTMNILEPRLLVRSDISRQVLPEQIDVVLVPGLAFDRHGNRLGRGKGFYDRFLCHLPRNVLTIGLAFDVMMRDKIPCGEYDEPVKMIITESGIVHE